MFIIKAPLLIHPDVIEDTHGFILLIKPRATSPGLISAKKKNPPFGQIKTCTNESPGLELGEKGKEREKEKKKEKTLTY